MSGDSIPHELPCNFRYYRQSNSGSQREFLPSSAVLEPSRFPVLPCMSFIGDKTKISKSSASSTYQYIFIINFHNGLGRRYWHCRYDLVWPCCDSMGWPTNNKMVRVVAYISRTECRCINSLSSPSGAAFQHCLALAPYRAGMVTHNLRKATAASSKTHRAKKSKKVWRNSPAPLSWAAFWGRIFIKKGWLLFATLFQLLRVETSFTRWCR